MREVPDGYKRTVVGVIPQDWRVEVLSSVANVKTGPFGSALHERDYVDDGTPIITVEHLSEHGIAHYGLPLVSDADRSRLRSYGLRAGDIVFSRVGSVDRNSLVSKKEDGWLFSGRLLRIRTSDRSVHPPYLSYHFHSEPFKKRIRSVAVGQTMASLNTQILKEVGIVLPTPPEQRAIAEALSDVDSSIKSLKTLIAKKKAIKQATMQQLLTGKTRLPGFSGAWDRKRIGDLFETTAGGDFDPVRSSIVKDESHPFPIYANSLSLNGLYGYSDHAENGPGSITITARGTLGKAFYRDTPFVAIGRLLVLKPKICMDARFFSSYINHGVRFAIESTGVPQLTAPHVARYFLPVPPKAEQYAISETLSDMDAEIASLEQCKDKTLAIKQGMMQQLLTGRVRLVQPTGKMENSAC